MGATHFSGPLFVGDDAETVNNTALLLGTGTATAADRYDMGSTANKNLLGFWATTSATSGDTRGMYLRLYFSGAGGSGEAARIFGTVNNVTAATGGTVNGAHVSLSVTGASGAVSGAGNAARFTLGLGASTNAGGTLAGIQVDSDFDTAATVPTNAAAIRVTDSNTKKWTKFLSMPTVASAGILAAHTTDALTHSIRCVDAAGTVFYLMATTTATNRTGGA